MFGRFGTFGVQLASTVVFLAHNVVEKAVDAGIAPPPVLVGAAVAVCGTSYVVKRIHRRNLHNRNNRKSQRHKVFDNTADFAWCGDSVASFCA